MAAYLKSLSLANCSNTIRSVASLVLAAREDDKDGDLWPKIDFFTFRHWGAMETAHWPSLFTGIDNPCAQLACLKTASPALSLPCSWKILMKITENDEVKILTGERNEQGNWTR
jgi:hypothetical protein